MSEYQLELKQIVDYPRCRIYRQFIGLLMKDKSIRVGGTSGLYHFTVLSCFANFRTSYKRIDGISYTISPGEWLCRVSELTEWFRTRFQHQALAILRELQDRHLITYTLLGRGRLVKFKIKGWCKYNRVLEYNAPCQKDTGYARHPKEVTFTSNLKLDLERRDFTINAMAYNHRAGLVDEFDGIGDLKAHVIRCVGCAHDRFSEDALRMFRAVRFAAQLGFDIEAQTKAAIKELAPAMSKVSAERIQVELVKLLTSDHPQMMRDLYELGLTAVFMPEFDVMMQTPQHNKHHMYSVGEHTLHTLEHVRADKILRLTMLLHDVAKPVCITTDEEGQNHFKKHPVVGADMTRKILRRLKFDNRTTDCCCKLVKEHDDRPDITERNVRRAMSRIGTELFPLLFEVKRADTLGQSMYKRAEKLEYIAEYERVYRKILADHQCVSKKEMKINGSDLIKMGVEPGPKLGDILDRLYEQVLDDPSLNEAQKLKELANKIITSLI